MSCARFCYCCKIERVRENIWRRETLIDGEGEDLKNHSLKSEENFCGNWNEICQMFVGDDEMDENIISKRNDWSLTGKNLSLSLRGIRRSVFKKIYISFATMTYTSAIIIRHIHYCLRTRRLALNPAIYISHVITYQFDSPIKPKRHSPKYNDQLISARKSRRSPPIISTHSNW